MINDLLDKLYGSQFFSKLDLRSKYYQVRILEENVMKTTFKTPYGHYEFKIIPFKLTNALTTFQVLMNIVLESFLKKFILVIFMIY